MNDHVERVRKIAAAVKGFHETKQKFRIDHGHTNSTRNQAAKGKHIVDTSNMNHVLAVNLESRTILAEPNVTMDRLVEAALAHDLIPLVVMDFPGITAGGGFAGTACESSSFKHGLFSDTVNSIELVLGNGEVVVCSKEERADLFQVSAGAMGTTGVLTQLEIRLRPARKYVETTYQPVTSLDEAVEKCRAKVSESSDDDFIDGILYSSTSGAVITGRYTNDTSTGLSVQRFSASKDPWFYSHVRDSIATTHEPVTELIPLPEYLFRYDRGAFWVGESIFAGGPGNDGPLPNTRTIKSWLDPFLKTRMLYAAVHSGGFNGQIIQDMIISYDKATSMLEWVAEEMEIWPLWLCPVKPSPNPTLHPHANPVQSHGPQPPMLNIGIWGTPSDPTVGYWLNVNKRLEQKLREIGCMKWMYGVNLENDEDFWGQHDKAWYDELRKKYHAEWLPSIADKARTTPEKCEEQIGSCSWKDYILFKYFPGFCVTALCRAWRSGAWKHDKAATWPQWVPREKK